MLQQVLSNQADKLEMCANRFSYSDEETISPHAAAKQVLVDGVEEDHIYECTCVLQCVLPEIGGLLEDSTPNGSLSINGDFWLDDFVDIFEAIGSKTLAENWGGSNIEFSPSGASPGWPAVTLLRTIELQACHDELSASDYVALISKLPERLFTKKDDDAIAEYMIHNMRCIEKWISECISSGSELVLFFDGQL